MEPREAGHSWGEGCLSGAVSPVLGPSRMGLKEKIPTQLSFCLWICWSSPLARSNCKLEGKVYGETARTSHFPAQSRVERGGQWLKVGLRRGQAGGQCWNKEYVAQRCCFL